MTFDIEKWRQTHVLYPQTTFRCASGEGAGDCIRASIATLLQIDPTTLTNWMELPDGEWDARMTADLRALGYEIASVTVDAAREVWGALEPQGPVLLAGLTAKGQPHCTVGLLDGTLLHDRSAIAGALQSTRFGSSHPVMTSSGRTTGFSWRSML